MLGTLAIMACAESPVSPTPSVSRAGSETAGIGAEQTFVIIGAGETFPADLEMLVAAAGGSLVAFVPDVGVAQAISSSPNFRATLANVSGIESVTPDMALQWTRPIVADEVVDESTHAIAEAASIGDNETFFSLQWANVAVHAPEAWTAGYTGKNVRVAILDGGLYSRHFDLTGHVDLTASRSFVKGFTFDQDVGTLWHGTHVAGIVGAKDNSFGTIGVAPNTTLIGVKVLHNGVGTFAAIFQGIVYAATPKDEGGAGANVINMSLGATLDEKATKKDIRELTKAIDLATKYAWKRGVTVIASAGNEGINLDDEKELFVSPFRPRVRLAGHSAPRTSRVPCTTRTSASRSSISQHPAAQMGWSSRITSGRCARRPDCSED
jgi:subtilisin family serine protease